MKRQWNTNPRLFQAWKDGKTGYPIIDANMLELKATGFMSNRGRQIVCSFLAIELNIDWRLGAEYFEETLIDYNVEANWVNWSNGAGVSLATGGRLNRFNIVKQSKTYDRNGEYVRIWCPELCGVPDEFVHEPWRMSEAVMSECGVTLGRNYPLPIVDLNKDPKSTSTGHEKQNKSKNNANKKNHANKNDDISKGHIMKSLPTGSYQFDQNKA